MTLPLPPRLMVRNGTYYFRICVPKDIIGLVGRRLIVRSLRTSNLKQARAKLPYFIVAAETEFDALRSRQRDVAVGEAVRSTQRTRVWISDTFVQRVGIPAAISPSTIPPQPRIGEPQQLGSTGAEASPIAAQETNSEAIAAERRIHQPSQPPLDTSPSHITTTVSPLSIDDLFDQWERETKPSASTLSSWRGHKRHFKAFFGARADDLQTITDADIVAWKNRLITEGKASATISRSYLGFAGALFRYAVSNRLLKVNPTIGIKVAGKAKAGTKMLGYTNEEVTALLASAAASGVAWKRWLPWLAAATGSRIGEMAQLHGSHIGVENGITVVRIAPAPDAGSLKNVGSERTVPVHPALVEQGFLDFVAERGAGPLFYEKTSGDPKRKHASKSVTNRLAAWIRELGYKDPRKAPNHALRHWFKSECARLQIEDSVVDAIQGHLDRSSAGIYRHITIEMMKSAIDAVPLVIADSKAHARRLT